MGTSVVDIPQEVQAPPTAGMEGNSVMTRDLAKEVVSKTEGNMEFAVPEEVLADAPFYERREDGIYRTDEQMDDGEYNEDQDATDTASSNYADFEGIDAGGEIPSEDVELGEWTTKTREAQLGRQMADAMRRNNRPNIVRSLQQMKQEKMKSLEAADDFQMPDDANGLLDDGSEGEGNAPSAMETDDINQILQADADEYAEDFPIELSNGFRVWAHLSSDLQAIVKMSERATKLANKAKKMPRLCPQEWLPYTKSMDVGMVRAAILVSMVITKPKVNVLAALTMMRTRRQIFQEISAPIIERINVINKNGPQDVEDEKNS